MQFKQLLTDNDAVSPVIGVILMVAITVILAAVIGTFVLGLGDQVSDSAPTASFTFEQGSQEFGDSSATGSYEVNLDKVTVTHDGGDAIAKSNLQILVNGDPGIDLTDQGQDSQDDAAASFTGSDDMTAGSSVEVEARYVGGSYDTQIPVTGSVTYTSTASGPNIDTPDDGGSDALEPLTADDTIRVVWSSSSGGDTATLGKFTLA